MVRSPQSERSVLVVDDEEMMRRLLDTALRSFGLNVRLAANGQDAIQLYRDHAEKIAVVLLDMRMPGLDGLQTLAELKRLNPSVCCCFMSGYSGQYAEDELQELGAVRIFEKPFRVHDLAQELSRLTL